jgi:hypothetical protein
MFIPISFLLPPTPDGVGCAAPIVQLAASAKSRDSESPARGLVELDRPRHRSPPTLYSPSSSDRPVSRAVLDRYGLAGCGGAHGPHEAVAFFARAHQVDLARLLEELPRRRSPARRPSPTRKLLTATEKGG